MCGEAPHAAQCNLLALPNTWLASRVVNGSRRDGSNMEQGAASWSVEEVGRWLGQLGLGNYAATFADEAIDGAALLALGTSAII